MKSIPIQVNDLVFPSARAAARYIVAEEAKLGNTRKENTIAKELKRCWSGHSWEMYGRWLVGTGARQPIVGDEAEGRLGTDVDG